MRRDPDHIFMSIAEVFGLVGAVRMSFLQARF